MYMYKRDICIFTVSRARATNDRQYVHANAKMVLVIVDMRTRAYAHLFA